MGPLEVDRGVLRADSGIKPRARGMKYRHYAPRAELTIVEGETERVIAEVNRLTSQAELTGKQVGIIATDETAKRYEKGLVRSLGARSCEEEISRHLFEVLRSFDETDVDYIYSESFETAAIGQAIMNRLLKAAGYRVIEVGK